MRAMGLPSFYRKDWAKVHDKQMASICNRKTSRGIRRQPWGLRIGYAKTPGTRQVRDVPGSEAGISRLIKERFFCDQCALF